MNNSVVSVIIPVYNGARTLEAALHSVISQSYSSIELIVVDGQSTDQTLRIVEIYRHAIHTLISEPDRGIYDAINKGIQQSSGQWIYILGADDALASQESLEKMLSKVKVGTQLITGDVEYTGEKQSFVPRIHRSYWSDKLYWRNTVHQQGALYHRSLFDDFRFDTRYRILGDYDFHLNLYRQGINTEHRTHLIARCAAQGTSKRFGRELYLEEIKLKRRRIPVILWLLNLPVILAKYLLKQLP